MKYVLAIVVLVDRPQYGCSYCFFFFFFSFLIVSVVSSVFRYIGRKTDE